MKTVRLAATARSAIHTSTVRAMEHYLKQRYHEEIVPKLMQDFSLSNSMEAPRLRKIVVNIGAGEAMDDAKLLDAAITDLSAITGQHPVATRAKKSIANFKLREGRSIGAKVTLRGLRMWSFFDRLVNVALPRTRDFRGLSPDSFDGRGNYTLGIREQLIFPEIDYDKIDKLRGFEVTVVTSAPNDEQGRRLLTLLGMPFRKAETNV